MQFYQMNKEQLNSFFQKESKSNISNENDERKKWNILKKAFFEFCLKCKEQSSYLSIILLSLYSINAIFSILNKDWKLLWIGISLFVLTVLVFSAECFVLQSMRKKYMKRIQSEENKVEILREGHPEIIDIDDLNCGDCLILRKGTILCADARIIEADHLYADEEVVFGKTISSKKISSSISENNLYPEDQTNMVWKGSYVSEGSGLAIVVATGEDSYVYKTGGRGRKEQKSAIYNQKNNIGKITTVIFVLISVLLMLLGGFISRRWLEAILLCASFLSVFTFEPASFITEWAYYYTAEKFFNKGILIRNIQAFDGMNREKDVFIDSLTFLQDGDEDLVNYNGDESLNRLLRKNSVVSLNKVSLSVVDDEADVYVSLTGYWKDVLPYIKNQDDALIQQINTFESHGRAVGFLAYKALDFAPSNVNKEDYLNQLELKAIVLIQPMINDELYQKISRLRKNGVRVILDNHHSNELGNYLASSYDLDVESLNKRKEQSYSLPGSSSTAAWEISEQIHKEKAGIVYKSENIPLLTIYDTKCLICGIERSLNYLYLILFGLMIGSFAAFLMNKDSIGYAFLMLVVQLPLFSLCYHIITSVKNCNQSRMSLVFGGLFGMMIIISSLIIGHGAVVALGLSAVFYSAFLFAKRIRYFGWKKLELILLVLLMILMILSCIVAGCNVLIVLLFALFPALTCIIIDFLY